MCSTSITPTEVYVDGIKLKSEVAKMVSVKTKELEESNNYLKFEIDKSKEEFAKCKEIHDRKMHSLSNELESAKKLLTSKNLLIAELEVYKDFYDSVLHGERHVEIHVGDSNK